MFEQIKEKYSKKLEYFSHKGLDFPKLISNASRKYFEVGNIFLCHYNKDKKLMMLCAAFDLLDVPYDVYCVDIETGISFFGSLNQETLNKPEWKQFIKSKTFHRRLVASRCGGTKMVFVAKNLTDLLKQC